MAVAISIKENKKQTEKKTINKQFYTSNNFITSFQQKVLRLVQSKVLAFD